MVGMVLPQKTEQKNFEDTLLELDYRFVPEYLQCLNFSEFEEQNLQKQLTHRQCSQYQSAEHI